MFHYHLHFPNNTFPPKASQFNGKWMKIICLNSPSILQLSSSSYFSIFLDIPGDHKMSTINQKQEFYQHPVERGHRKTQHRQPQKKKMHQHPSSPRCTSTICLQTWWWLVWCGWLVDMDMCFTFQRCIFRDFWFEIPLDMKFQVSNPNFWSGW